MTGDSIYGVGVQLAPVRLDEGVVTLRSPRAGDAAAWSAARLANREWLEPAFPAWGADWDAEQNEIAWVQRWRQLRLAMLRGKAMPFVILLDGTLIGEIGVDALDEVSNSGEASVWMVRAHGSSMVMYVASLLLLEHAFTSRYALDRLISPVATTSRRGRSPGLTAVGLQLEATVARRTAHRGFVDHDIWIAHNTAAFRAATTAKLAVLGSATPGQADAATPMSTPDVARAVTRAGVRGARAAVRGVRTRHRDAVRAVPGDGVTLRPRTVREAGVAAWLADSRSARDGDLIPWVIESRGRIVGDVRVRLDVGTGTAEVSASLEARAERAALHTALMTAINWLTAHAADLRIAIRVPADAPGRLVADEQMLASLGFALVATFPGSAEAPQRWAGEQRWECANAG